MKYTEIIPGELNDTVFPGAHMEIIFNLGEGIWKSSVNNSVFNTTPQVELWGKLTQPLVVKSVGMNKMLGIRFYAHSAACFLNEEVWEFNDQVSDLRDLLGPPVRILHAKLREAPQLDKRVQMIEEFLLGRLVAKERKLNSTHISMIAHRGKRLFPHFHRLRGRICRPVTFYP